MIVGPLAELEEEMMTADGFEDAIIGHCYDMVAGEFRVIYSYNKCIDILKRHMSEDDAREHMDFNVTGSHMGSKTPLFMISA